MVTTLCVIPELFVDVVMVLVMSVLILVTYTHSSLLIIEASVNCSFYINSLEYSG